MAILENLVLLDSLKHSESTWMEKGNWSKMTWATSAVHDTETGASFESFSTTTGSFWNLKKYKSYHAVSFQRNLAGDISERYWSLWLCYNNTSHNGYRVKFVDQTEVKKCKAIIYRVVEGVETELGATTEFELHENEKFAIIKNGKWIEIYHYYEGAWHFLLEKEDTENKYTEGYIGLDGTGSDPKFTEFSAEELNTEAKLSGKVSVKFVDKASLNRTESRTLSGISKVTFFNSLRLVQEGFGNKAFQYYQSLKDRYPLNLVIGEKNYTSLLTETFSFSNVDPGGFESASFNLPKDLPEVLRGMHVRLDCGTKVAWEGRVKEVQRSMSAKTLIQCEGYGAQLKKELMKEIYIDQDFSKWQGPSIKLQYEGSTIGHNIIAPSVGASPEANEPALVTSFNGAWEAAGVPYCDAFYDAHGIPLGYIYYAWRKTGSINGEDTKWHWETLLSHEENPLAYDIANLRTTAGTGSGTLVATTETRKWAAAILSYEIGPAGGANTLYAIYWTHLAVYGRHGLSKHGAEPGGFYTSDIVKNALSNAESVAVGVIPEATGYIVPQCAYLTPVPIEKIISDMSKLVSCHWGVWESLEYLCGNQKPRIDFRPYPTEPTCWIKRTECQELDVRENLENIYNKASISYTETAGIERAVEVTTFNNPVLNEINLWLERNGEAPINQTLELSIGVSTEAAAKAYGELALVLMFEQARITGTAVIYNPVHEVVNNPNTSYGVGYGDKPAFLLKSGIDRLRVPDLPSYDVWGENNELPITRISCNGSPEGIVTNLEFGLNKNTLESFQAQLQANLAASNSGSF